MISTDLLARYRFFLEHAGYATPPGRVACAMALARAEERAIDMGMNVVWRDEVHAWDGDCPAPAVHAYAYVTDPTDQRFSIAGLSGIGLNSWGDPYRRVVEAELCAEAFDFIDKRTDARNAALANELAARATYAGPSDVR